MAKGGHHKISVNWPKRGIIPFGKLTQLGSFKISAKCYILGHIKSLLIDTIGVLANDCTLTRFDWSGNSSQLNWHKLGKCNLRLLTHAGNSNKLTTDGEWILPRRGHENWDWQKGAFFLNLLRMVKKHWANIPFWVRSFKSLRDNCRVTSS